MSETATALLRFRDLLEEAIEWADVNGDSLMAIRLEEARACIDDRISEEG